MNSILEAENSNAYISENHRLEIYGERAKITGLVCIGCAAAAAVLFAFLLSVLYYDTSTPVRMIYFLGSLLYSDVPALLNVLYFVFLLIAAVIGVFGYSEIKAVRSGLASSIFQLVSIVFSGVLLLSVSGKPTTQFAVTYGIFAVCIPLMLTILTLAANKTAVWKALAPAAVPVFHAFAYLLFGSTTLLFVLPLGWALLGMVAYSGRKIAEIFSGITQ